VPSTSGSSSARRWNCDPSKRREVLAQRQSVISQKIRTCSNTGPRTSYLATFLLSRSVNGNCAVRIEDCPKANGDGSNPCCNGVMNGDGQHSCRRQLHDDDDDGCLVDDWDRTVAGVKEQAFARLQEELSKAHQELRLRDEEVNRLSRIREEVEAELEELTASLFQVGLSSMGHMGQREVAQIITLCDWHLRNAWLKSHQGTGGSKRVKSWSKPKI